MELRLVEHDTGFDFRWPSGTVERYEDRSRHGGANLLPGLDAGRICIAVGWKSAYGARRGTGT